jgi:hypothetical protein
LPDFEEAELAAPAHIGHDFDRTAKIGIGMPCGSEDAEVSFHQNMLPGDVSPERACICKLTLRRRDFAWKRRAGCNPNESASLAHIQLQQKTSPLASGLANTAAATIIVANREYMDPPTYERSSDPLARWALRVGANSALPKI